MSVPSNHAVGIEFVKKPFVRNKHLLETRNRYSNNKWQKVCNTVEKVGRGVANSFRFIIVVNKPENIF